MSESKTSDQRAVRSIWTSLGKLRRLFHARDRRAFGLLILIMFGRALFETAGVGIVPMVVAAILNSDSLLAHDHVGPILRTLGLTSREFLLLAGAVLVVLVFLLKALYVLGATYAQARILQNRQTALTRRLFTAYLHAPWEYHLRVNSATILRNVISEVTMLFTDVLSPALAVVLSGMTGVCILALLLSIEPLLTLVAVLSLGLLGGLVVHLLNRRTAMLGMDAQEQRRNQVSAINQGLGSLKEVRLLRREQHFVDILTNSVTRLAATRRFQAVVSVLPLQFLEFLSVTLIMILAVLLLYQGRDGTAIAVTLALFAMALMRLRATLAQIMGALNRIRFRADSVDVVYDDLERLAALARDEQPHSSDPIRLSDCIELNDVTYRYAESSADTLSNVSLTISSGASVGIVGPTGSGKTTLVDVILGLLRPTSGAVRVDGRSIRDNLPSWQRRVAYVPQAIYLTDDTIRRNVALGLKDDEVDEDSVWAALDAAQIGEFVRSQPAGIETDVGERGVRLSGGQRQRIGIARALYGEPDLLVLDEGTSALDRETELAVMEAVEGLRGHCTIILIAHRSATLGTCDVLYEVSDGGVVPVRE